MSSSLKNWLKFYILGKSPVIREDSQLISLKQKFMLYEKFIIKLDTLLIYILAIIFVIYYTYTHTNYAAPDTVNYPAIPVVLLYVSTSLYIVVNHLYPKLFIYKRVKMNRILHAFHILVLILFQDWIVLSLYIFGISSIQTYLFFRQSSLSLYISDEMIDMTNDVVLLEVDVKKQLPIIQNAITNNNFKQYHEIYRMEINNKIKCDTKILYLFLIEYIHNSPLFQYNKSTSFIEILFFKHIKKHIKNQSGVLYISDNGLIIFNLKMYKEATDKIGKEVILYNNIFLSHSVHGYSPSLEMSALTKSDNSLMVFDFRQRVWWK